MSVGTVVDLDLVRIRMVAIWVDMVWVRMEVVWEDIARVRMVGWEVMVRVRMVVDTGVALGGFRFGRGAGRWGGGDRWGDGRWLGVSTIAWLNRCVDVTFPVSRVELRNH
jgi:hypothetical protein